MRHLTPALLALTLILHPAGPAASDAVTAGREALRAGDDTAALAAFRAGAASGDRTAQFLAGQMLLQGKGAARDVPAALAYLEQAARAGHVGAQTTAGSLYAFGDPVPADYDKAFAYLLPAARAGDAHAQNNLATLYWFGLGTARDPVQALHWAMRAERRHLMAAIRLKDEIERQVTPAVEAEATALATQPLTPDSPGTPPPRRDALSPPAVPGPDSPRDAVPTPAGDWAVQLGALPSAADADRHWRRLSRRHTALLAARTPRFASVVLEGKGSVTRILVPGFDRAGAEDLCSRLKAAGAACLIRRDGPPP
ncbi:SPOR domain-containing protein [Oleisolibacter albus]|uniref:SPOR domain-containing protein n=1 Tax=Oleisolibacter albus TaxID=2171757 RepID=UPI000DF18129|nr:SPOR domain-containing protein [Oleisolibacter albus]